MWREQKQPWEACLHWPAVTAEVPIQNLPEVLCVTPHMLGVGSLCDFIGFTPCQRCSTHGSIRIILVVPKSGQRSKPVSTSRSLSILEIQDFCGSLSAEHYSILIDLFVLLSGKTKQNIL